MSITLFQAPLCDHKGIKCIESVEINEAQCLKRCEGLVVTSYVKSSDDSRILYADSKHLMKVKAQYDKYKILTPIKKSTLEG